MLSKTQALAMYQSLMDNFPAPGGGGAHLAFFKAGALGFEAGIPEAKVVEDSLAHLPQGGRTVREDEVADGVAKGFAKAMGIVYNKEARSVRKVAPDTFAKLVSVGTKVVAEDLVAASPVKLDFPDEDAGIALLTHLYKPGEFVFVGERIGSGKLGKSVRTAADWLVDLKSENSFARKQPHVIANPLNGLPEKSKTGVDTYRGDANVAAFRYAVVEFDGVPLAQQIAFWAVVKLPVAALIMSGGKSVHGWVQVDCDTRAEWETEIENDLFPCYLVPMGVDGACRNEARLSRMPGNVRADTGAMQKLLYLAPGGRAVCG